MVFDDFFFFNELIIITEAHCSYVLDFICACIIEVKCRISNLKWAGPDCIEVPQPQLHHVKFKIEFELFRKLFEVLKNSVIILPSKFLQDFSDAI